MTAPPPAQKGPPPAAKPPGASAATSNKDFAVSTGRVGGAQRILIYGSGGIGKSSLAALAPNPIFLDVEGGTKELGVKRISNIETLAELRFVLGSDKVDPFDTVVIDTVTKVEEMAVAHTLATVPHEKGHLVDRLDAYGFGRGLAHVYETTMLVLQDCDRLIRRNKHVILIAHDCTNDVPNPNGEDFLRTEPHLQSPKSGKSSIRNRVVQWVDHALYIGYDVAVTNDGKGRGSGTRTIWTSELPTHIAKVRGRHERNIPNSMQFKFGDPTIWNLILNSNSGEPK